MNDATILLAILIPSLGLFSLGILYMYFIFNQRTERLNKELAGEHYEPTKLNPLNLDLVLTVGTVYLIVSTLLILGMTGKINDATMGAILAGMVGFVLGNRLGKSI